MGCGGLSYGSCNLYAVSPAVGHCQSYNVTLERRAHNHLEQATGNVLVVLAILDLCRDNGSEGNLQKTVTFFLRMLY